MIKIITLHPCEEYPQNPTLHFSHKLPSVLGGQPHLPEYASQTCPGLVHGSQARQILKFSSNLGQFK